MSADKQELTHISSVRTLDAEYELMMMGIILDYYKCIWLQWVSHGNLSMVVFLISSIEATLIDEQQ